MRVARGTASLSSSSFLPARVPAGAISTPVTLPSGFARLFTRPSATGSTLPSITMGTCVLARRMACTAEEPIATMTSTRRRTRSRASAGRSWSRPLA